MSLCICIGFFYVPNIFQSFFTLYFEGFGLLCGLYCVLSVYILICSDSHTKM